MTKHVGYQPGDFHFEQAHRQASFTTRVLPRLFDLCMPLVIALLALYIGHYGLSG